MKTLPQKADKNGREAAGGLDGHWNNRIPAADGRGDSVIHACLHIDEHTLPVFSYLTRTFSLPTMYMPLASPLVASVGITSLRRSTPSTV